MKNYLLLLLAVITMAGFSSCNEDDEPEVNPLVGEWELDDVTITDAPPSFSMLLNVNSSNVYGEDAYNITFLSDFTYEREIDNIQGVGNLDDEGEWELLDDELILDPEEEVNGLTYEFNLVEEINDRNLVLSFDTQIREFPDEIYNDPEALDTVETQAGWDYMVENYTQLVTVTFELEFDRQ